MVIPNKHQCKRNMQVNYDNVEIYGKSDPEDHDENDEPDVIGFPYRPHHFINRIAV